MLYWNRKRAGSVVPGSIFTFRDDPNSRSEPKSIWLLLRGGKMLRLSGSKKGQVKTMTARTSKVWVLGVQPSYGYLTAASRYTSVFDNYHGCTNANALLLTVSKEVKSMYEPTKPINVPKDALVEAIQATLDKKKADFEAKIAAQKDRVARVFSALTSTDPLVIGDVLTCYFGSLGSDASVEKAIGQINEAAAAYAEKEAAKPPTDESLERAVRALTMASDSTIEIAPTDDLYKLL